MLLFRVRVDNGHTQMTYARVQNQFLRVYSECFGVDKHKPVSYTHLDVYKRQT